MQAWNSFSSPQEMNCSSKLTSDNCLVNQCFHSLIDHFTQFQSSPAVPTSSIINKVNGIQESGKLGPVCSSGGNQFSSGNSLAPAPAPNFHGRNGGVGNHGFDPISNEFIEENLPNLGNSLALDHHLSPLSNDPEFTEMAAKFYCFGNRNFNLPRSHSISAVNVTELPHNAIDMTTIWNSPLQQGGSPTEINNLKELPPIPPNSNECSSISDQIPSGEEVSNEMNSRKRKALSKNIAMKNVSTKAVNSLKGVEEDDDIKGKRRRTAEAKSSKKGGINKEEVTVKSDEPPKDYIHVRARRGQATDSHSLAERVRREKIGERMKLLQDLVPGCNKVTGKALMLDEIINYVQSLQRQVEFLSMKLASVDPRKEVDINNVTSKPIIQQNAPLPQSLYTQDLSVVPSFYGHHQQKQSALMNINPSLSQCSMEPVHKPSYHTLESQLLSLNAYADGLPQFNALCDDDLHSIVRMGLGQNANKKQRFNQ